MTNWYVITGGPSSGKTTTVQLLRERGHTTTIEHARHYIDLARISGQSVEEIRARQLEFQHGVLTMQLDEEASLNPDEIVFLDRALPDALAYYRFLHLEPDAMVLSAVEHARYKKVFVLDLLPLARDYARTEDEHDQRVIHDLLLEVYRELGFPVIQVPVLPPTDRVDFILERI